MPIFIPKLLPARKILEKESMVFVDEDDADFNELQKLNILILNLMPEKEKSERMLLRLLGSSSHLVRVTFLKTCSYTSKNTSQTHLEQFYLPFSAVKSNHYDGLIITGAPIEHLPFDQVAYWQELVEIMEWSKINVTSTLHICWGAQAALYHHYGIEKYELPKKHSGVFEHQVEDSNEPILLGISNRFLAPVSRYTDVLIEKIKAHPELKLLAYSDETGPLLMTSSDRKLIMITGHLEYETETLAQEYIRDLEKGLNIHVPKNYFPNDNPENQPENTWRSTGKQLFHNWMKYYAFQKTFNW